MQSEPTVAEPDIADLRVGVVSYGDSVPFVSEGDTPSRATERVLVAGFCGTCSLPVMRRFDLIGVELVIEPWKHYANNINHPVGEIKTERYCEG